MQITQGLRRALQVNADGIATIFGNRRHDYRTFAGRSAKLAGALSALGVSAGDRVAILALNSDRYLEYFFACWTIGAVAVPLNIRWAAEELIMALRDSGASSLFIDENFLHLYEPLTAASPTLREVVYLGEANRPENLRDYEEILDAAKPAADAGYGGNDLAGIYYTGGTTGRSKGAMLSHRNFVFNAVNYAATVGFDAQTHWLHAAPMFHIADANGILTTTLVGGAHSFLPSFKPEPAMALIQNNRINFCLFIPTMINMLVNHPAVSNYDLSHPVRCQFGGSPMPEAVLRQATKALPSWQFIHSFGMTELSPFVTALNITGEMLSDPVSRRLRSCGRAAIGCDVRIIDDAGLTLPAGKIGELVVRGDNVMLGYWNRPAETDAALKDGWMHTGDLAYMDEHGHLYIVDRLKDMIITGGENVYPAEVEQIIHQLPQVVECAVIGLPDAKWGERVHAVVRCVTGATLAEQDVIDYCRKHLGGYKCPRGVTFRDEPMPLTGASKIRKSELRAALLALGKTF
jgi:long-chain acyl-CoA synthetase